MPQLYAAKIPGLPVLAFLADGGLVVGWVGGTGVVRLLGRKPSFLWELDMDRGHCLLLWESDDSGVKNRHFLVARHGD